jgi:periplasmic mercuric ion binding protein
MKKTLLAASFVVLATGGMAIAAEVQSKIEVSGLFCPSCTYIAGTAMKSVESVEIVGFAENSRNQTAVFVVSYDDEKATPALITEAVAGYGYEAKVLTDTGS